MDIITIIVIAVGLAMDAFAVSIAAGSSMRGSGRNHAFRIAIFFGGFQAAMPIIGWLLGISVRGIVADYDHWIAFGLLVFIGSKMIYESFAIEKANRAAKAITNTALFVLAVATSIDALAVGITFSFLLPSSLLIAVTIIGAITFTLSYAGVHIGRAFGHLCENKIEALGGIILIAIAIKILLEHL